jgi:hypothetical protein
MQAGARVLIQWDFQADGDNELDVAANSELIVLEDVSEEWIKVKNPQTGEVGCVPHSYVKVGFIQCLICFGASPGGNTRSEPVVGCPSRNAQSTDTKRT